MIAVVVVLVLGGAGVLVATLSGGDDNRSGPTQPTTAPPPPSASSEPNPVPSSTPTSSTPTSATEPTAPRLTEATALATRFLGYVNAADQKHALALGCEDSRQILAGLLVFMIDPPTKLTVSGKPVATQTYYRKISVPYSGTTKGPVPRTGTVDIMDQPSTPLCVRLTTMR
ncbi:MAG TPA: hypothetical protein VGL05_35600 [Kribbella sp.]